MQFQKVQKSSWNEPYSSSSFIKQSCSKTALYRWIKTGGGWNKKLISLSSSEWSASLWLTTFLPAQRSNAHSRPLCVNASNSTCRSRHRNGRDGLKKVKFSHTRYRALGPELITVYRQSARRWREVNHAIDLAVACRYFLPGLRLPP